NPPHRISGSGDCFSQGSPRIPLLQRDADGVMPVNRHDANSHKQEAGADGHLNQGSDDDRKIHSSRASVSAPSAKIDCIPLSTVSVMQTVDGGSATCQDNRHHATSHRNISKDAPKQE
ncbi:unnamed protein product, partial [Sphacelaria rigidula]